MIPFLDQNKQPMTVGDRVEACVCTGRFGQMTTYRGNSTEVAMAKKKKPAGYNKFFGAMRKLVQPAERPTKKETPKK